MVAIVGTVTLVRVPVDLFPTINIPVVVVATFYSGMPPQQIETNITNPFERFFTLASGVDHIESRSLPGVSLSKVYFQPGTNADAAVSTITNLAMAQLRRLPPGTLPPVVLKFDASSLPVCLITLKGQGLNETQLQDLGRYTVRNQIANVPGASVPQPFGGRYRQIMVYVDPLKLEAHQLSPMNVLREGGVGLILTGLMVLLFLGSLRATAAVFLSIPLSALAAFLALGGSGGSVNTMVLGGLALAFSRLIDNSVIVLENIFRHLELGEAPEAAAERGGREVGLAVLAATLTTSVVFFPVVFLYGVSRFLFVALALAVVLSLFASYFVAMTVVPLFCAKWIKQREADEELGDTFTFRWDGVGQMFNFYFRSMLEKKLNIWPTPSQ